MATNSVIKQNTETCWQLYPRGYSRRTQDVLWNPELLWVLRRREKSLALFAN